MSRTLSGLFLVGALNRLRKRKRTNRENPWTIPEQIGKIPEKSGKSQKGQKRTKKEGQVQIGKPPRLKPPRFAALEKLSSIFREKIRVSKKKHSLVPTSFCERATLTISGGTDDLRQTARHGACKWCREFAMMPSPKRWASRNILWIFSSCLPGNFALKNGGDFWWIFSGLRFPRNEARNIPEKFGENSEQKFGANPGRKFEKFGELSFCNFSDRKVLFVFFPEATRKLGAKKNNKQKTHTVAVEIKSIIISKKLIVEFEMTFFGK